ncbi:MAG TPA: LLM class flavin-dependent oxidoreductase [Chloroflexota bacterium]|nr:LLM class flavin-dependent oxidoreductase [Chloroflexota bacterium]
MTPIRFGIGFAPTVPAPRVIETARLAEQLGFDVFWLTDSHLAAREAMTLLGALAVSTERIHLGTGVSHLAGRHFSVIASAMHTLDELAPGRVRLGIGVGDSGPLNLGVPRTSLRELEAAVVSIRQLLEGQAVDGPSRPLSLSSVKARSNPVPIYISGSAERTLRMTGRVADGALISGMPDQLSASIASVRAGEREAGRVSGSTRILLWTTVAVDDDREAARTAVRGSVARRALNSYGRLARAGQLDPEDAQALDRLQRDHAEGYRLEAVAGELVPERWIDRFAIAGTPQDVRARLEAAIQSGADEISMILMGPRSHARGGVDQLTMFAETVMRPMREALIATT